jgi:hypothetical protein
MPVGPSSRQYMASRQIKGTVTPDPQRKMKSIEGIGEMGGGCGKGQCVVNAGTERWEVKGGSVRG